MATGQESLSRKAKLAAVNALAGLIPSKLARIRANQKTNRALAHQFGDLRSDADWKTLSVKGLENESSQIFGLVVQSIRDIERPPESMLLAGQAASAKPVYASIAGIPVERISTAGLHDDADHEWNFEHAPPDIRLYQCVVSYAIFEHLIDPYRHVRDLCGLLEPEGHLVISRSPPGSPITDTRSTVCGFPRTGSKRSVSGSAWKWPTGITAQSASCIDTGNREFSARFRGTRAPSDRKGRSGVMDRAMGQAVALA